MRSWLERISGLSALLTLQDICTADCCADIYWLRLQGAPAVAFATPESDPDFGGNIEVMMNNRSTRQG